MDKAKIYEQVKSTIRDMVDDDNLEISPDSEMQELITDSLSFVECVLDLEERFDIDIADEDAEEFTTVQDCVNYIEKKLEENGR